MGSVRSDLTHSDQDANPGSNGDNVMPEMYDELNKAYEKGYNEALHDVMKRFKQIVAAYEKDKATQVRPNFYSAVSMVGLLLEESNERYRRTLQG